jgi:hydroxypyruvate isomerase
VHFAARERFAGVLYPWAIDSSVEERRAVTAALRETHLQSSCIVVTSWSSVMEPIWVIATKDAEMKLLGLVQRALDVAEEVSSQIVAVLLRGDGSTSSSVLRRRAMDRLRTAADMAGSRGRILGIEPMIAFPDMLLRTFAEGVEFVRTVNHPAVRLIFDTGHVTEMGDPLHSTFADAYDEICLLQLADMPGRVEPGAGEINFVPLLAEAIRRRYSGFVDLEHGWFTPGETGERRGIERLAAIDAEARRSSSKKLEGVDSMTDRAGDTRGSR